jgi:type I restriction enzyme M protein
LFFRPEKTSERKGHVLFVDGSKRFTKGRAQNSLSDADVEDLYTVFQSNGVEERADIAARLVAHEEIIDNGFDLNIGRYLKADAAEVIDVGEALAALEESRKELAAAETAMMERLKAAGYA